MAEIKAGILNGGRGSGQTVRRITAIYEEKIADLKANFGLAIEGRDIKIKELEHKNIGLENDVAHLERSVEYYKQMYKNIEQQIEKMKCCSNCKHWLDERCTVGHFWDCKNNIEVGEKDFEDYWECIE